MNDRERAGPNPWIAIAISIASLFVSFTTIYFSNFYTSEALYALLLDYREDLKDDEAKGLIADLVLVNSGNRNIIISKLQLGFIDTSGDSGQITPSSKAGVSVAAQKLDSEIFATPILIGPRGVEQLRVRFSFVGAPVRRPPSQPGEQVRTPLILIFTTIGSSGEIQESEMMAGNVDFKDGKYWGAGRQKTQPVRVRK